MAGELARLIERQMVSARALSDLLEAESGHLESREIEAIEGLAERKLMLVRTLESEAGRLAGLVRELGLENRAGAPPGVDPALAAGWRSLRALLESCRTRNSRNGAVIATLQSFGDRLVRLVTGRTATPTTYGPRGRMGTTDDTTRYSTVA